MTENNDRINKLHEWIETLLKRQEAFFEEINEVREEISKLKTTEILKNQIKEEEIKSSHSVNITSEIEKDKESEAFKNKIKQASPEFQNDYAELAGKQLKIKTDLEKFIGENLANKIGIAITVIGVSIGAKYAIDHELISPLTRILLGYLFGFGLLGFSFRLKRKYENFSAVLMSGSMAIMYFITYSAYTFYNLIPQIFAFVLMVIFTAFTVTAAINYNRQVIAHIGLVGAYAVPFLLSEGSGKIEILFGYTAIINIGILVIAFKKYWKPLYYSSFLITWLMYLFWYKSNYQASQHYALALTFLLIFFVIFYIMFLAYKLIQKEKFDIIDVFLLLVNTFLFYSIGYVILSNHQTGKHLLGLFTLCNAIIHFIISAFIYKQNLADRNLFYLLSGLVLVFISLAVPVQLDGNWVTLLWAFEAVLLFWIGRTKNAPVYEILSYPLMLLAFFSILHDWQTNYNISNPVHTGIKITPIFNINFLTSILFIAVFIFINYLNKKRERVSFQIPQKALDSIITLSITAILLLVLYGAFRIEISTYWQQLHINSEIVIKTDGLEYPNNIWNSDLLWFQAIWMLNYSILFLSILSCINIIKLKNKILGLINIGLNTWVILVFLMYGLLTLSDLRESYLTQVLSDYYHRGAFSIGIRYISFAFVSLILWVNYKYIDQDFLKPVKFDIKLAYDFLLYTSLIWIASSELIAWMDIMNFTQSYKLGLSILWGVYALLLIVLGIWKKKKHLRIGAIALFAGTLIKLFFYDISHLDTVAKTIVFVSLGVLLLIISFLYNKYRHIMSEENINDLKL